MKGIGPILSNHQSIIQPRFVERQVDPSEMKVIPGADFSAVTRNLNAADGKSTKDVLSQYDLHNINKNDFDSLITILRDRKEISEQTSADLFAVSLTQFEDSPNTAKKDVIAAVESQANTYWNSSDYNPKEQVSAMISDNYKRSINALNSIQSAKETGADSVSINVSV